MHKKVAIMQPYFLPYIGYWQLMHFVDVFVIYDDIEFTKSGWIHRNRYLKNNNEADYFTLPLQKASDYLSIHQRSLSKNHAALNDKTLRKIKGAYQNAPYFEEGYQLARECFKFSDNNLFHFVKNSIEKVRFYLDINTQIIVSSALNIDESLKREERIFSICKALGASHYINPIGGKDLYSAEDFKAQDIALSFQNVLPYAYQQYDSSFVPHLSILDVVMFNGRQKTQAFLNGMSLIK